jgi:hypothetical protein
MKEIKNINMKQCSKCKEFKEITEFNKKTAAKDGYCSQCKSCKSNFNRNRYNKNRIDIRKKQTEYYKEHRNEIIQYKNKYQRDRLKLDINYKLTRNLRRRLHSIIKGKLKVGSAIKDLGCSVEFLKQYLESKFQEGMTWNNYNFKGWHIDHIIPLSSFDLTDKEQLLKACHYTNLQPLWAKDNLVKNNKL